jgi:hypothetical protein
MKKYLFLLFALVAMSSCEPRPARIVERTEEEMIIKMDIIRHFEYQGHKYISFQYSPTTTQSFMGIVHDPDCLCTDLGHK